MGRYCEYEAASAYEVFSVRKQVSTTIAYHSLGNVGLVSIAEFLDQRLHWVFVTNEGPLLTSGPSREMYIAFFSIPADLVDSCWRAFGMFPCPLGSGRRPWWL